MISPLSPMICARAVVLPPGAAHISRTLDPGAGLSTRAAVKLARLCSIISPTSTPEQSTLSLGIHKLV